MTTKPLTGPELKELADGLHRLSRNLWWSWDQEAQEIFQELSPRGWQNLYHNPVAVLREVSDYELQVRLQEAGFADRVRKVLAAFNAYLSEPNTWAAQHAPQLAKNPVAYFSAEFAFHECLPIAAGGLGALAGNVIQLRHAPRAVVQDSIDTLPLRPVCGPSRSIPRPCQGRRPAHPGRGWRPAIRKRTPSGPTRDSPPAKCAGRIQPKDL